MIIHDYPMTFGEMARDVYDSKWQEQCVWVCKDIYWYDFTIMDQTIKIFMIHPQWRTNSLSHKLNIVQMKC
jgi:hypothetical protein